MRFILISALICVLIMLNLTVSGAVMCPMVISWTRWRKSWTKPWSNDWTPYWLKHLDDHDFAYSLTVVFD